MDSSRIHSERGAILIHVAIGLLAVIALSSFVFDYGMMWVSRGQAQNAADAGALAGATSLAFDGAADVEATAESSALQVAQANIVWGQTAGVVAQYPVVCPNDGTNTCIRVDVYRDGTNNSTLLPTWFGQMIGVDSQGVRATAIAQAAVANASNCLKPVAIPDKWFDNHDETQPIDDVWTDGDRFEKTTGNGNNVTPLPDPDVYVAPTQGNPGSGFDYEYDIGMEVTIKSGNQNNIEPGFYFPVRLPRYDGDSTGGDDYRDNIATCNGIAIAEGTLLETEPGNMVGPTAQGFQALIDQDLGASWDSVNNTITGSCAPGCAAQSPRIVAIPVFNVEEYYQGKTNGLTVLRIVRILGFFVDRIQGTDVIGYLTPISGLVAGTSQNSAQSAFTKTPMLVR